MKSLEFRIPMPLELNQYPVGQNWTFLEQSKRETGGGEGVRIIEDKVIQNQQFTYKIYAVESKVPLWLRTLLRPLIGADNNAYEFHEEAWNAYPVCKTVITNPGYMKENFKVEIESVHSEGNPWKEGKQNARETEVLDIFRYIFLAPNSNFLKCESFLYFRDKCSYLNLDLSKNYDSNWMQSTQPIMTCYKTVTVHCKIFGLQTKLESLIMNAYRDMLLGFHQQMWHWLDNWLPLTLEEVAELEKQGRIQLTKKIATKQKCGSMLIGEQ